MEIIEDRHSKKSTVIASQLPVASWFETIEAVPALIKNKQITVFMGMVD